MTPPRRVPDCQSAVELRAQEIVQVVEGRLLCNEALTLVFFPHHRNEVDLHGKLLVKVLAEKQRTGSEHICVEG